MDRFNLYPAWLMGDSAYGSAEMLARLVYEPRVRRSTSRDAPSAEPTSPMIARWMPMSVRPASSCRRARRALARPSLMDEDGMMRYRASKLDCDACALKLRCCPTTPARKILRSIHEGARDMARAIADTDAYVRSRRQRKKVRCCSRISLTDFQRNRSACVIVLGRSHSSHLGRSRPATLTKIANTVNEAPPNAAGLLPSLASLMRVDQPHGYGPIRHACDRTSFIM